MKSQWHDEWEQIVAKRREDEASGVRRPHVPLRVYFVRAIYLTYAVLTVAFVGALYLLSLLA